MSEILNLSTICRCCHTDGNFRNLDLSYSCLGVTEVYVDMLYETFGLRLSEPPIEASHSICDICIEKLRNALQFKTQVEQCERMFEDYCKNELAFHIEVKVEKTDIGDEVVIKSEFSRSIKNKDYNDYSYEKELDDVNTKVSDNNQSYNYEEKILSTEQVNNCIEKPKSNIRKTIRRKNNNFKKEESNNDIQHNHSTEKQNSDISKSEKRLENVLKKDESGPRSEQNKCTLRRLKTDNAYICSTCNGSFKTQRRLKLHREDKHSIFTCKICKNTFNSESDLKRHARTHASRYQCNFCGNTFKSHGSLIAHKNTHTKENIFTCDMCNKEFLNRTILVKHIAFHLGRNKKFMCEICGKTFNDRTNFNIHIRNVHEKHKMFKCDRCPKIYALKKSLKSHLRTHTGGSLYKCKLCEKAFSWPSGLINHTKKFHTTSDSCTSGNLVANCTYSCKICGKVYHAQASLISHTRSKHNRVKPFMCHLCNKYFSCQFSLNRHILGHEGKGRVSCDICLKSFTQKSQMLRHMRNIHNPDKPFKSKIKCDLCKMSVTDMEKHIQSHTNRPHKCDQCSRSYSEKKALTRHIKERHCGTSYDCDLCDKKYIIARSLQAHKLKKHKILLKAPKVDRHSEN